jgi:hypothetical protein
VAELEAGNRKRRFGDFERAVDTEGQRPIAFLEDARQNMWRSQGRLDRRATPPIKWVQATPTSRLASTAGDRVLAKNYDRGARLSRQPTDSPSTPPAPGRTTRRRAAQARHRNRIGGR